MRKPPLKVQVILWTPDSEVPRFLIFQTTEERGGFWQPVTGTVEPGETLQQAAAREAMEETGWGDLPIPKDACYVHRYPIPPEKKSLYADGATELEEHAFAIQLSEQRDPHLNEEEHQAACWCALPEALRLVQHEANQEAIRRVAGVKR